MENSENNPDHLNNQPHVNGGQALPVHSEEATSKVDAVSSARVQPSDIYPSPIEHSAPPNKVHQVQDSTSTQATTPVQSTTDSGLIVLQWLTYAFWGWAVLALSSLTAAIIANLINKADVGEFMPYAIAALVVLLPIALICDSFYSKREPTKKSGAAMAVMLIHAVIFALLGVAALITAVVSVFILLIGTDSSKDTTVVLLSAIVVSAYYAATLLRTINPPKLPTVAKYYRFGMMVTVGLIIVLGIVGPVARERSLRNDRLLEENLSSLPSAISAYAKANDKLPTNLKELSNLNGGTKTIVEKGLVEYKPNTKTESLSQSDNTHSNYFGYSNSSRPTYYYELCATYKEESSSYGSSSSYGEYGDEYTTYLSAYSHPAGKQCYKMSTNYY